MDTKILVIAEHDNKTYKPATANTISAATQLGRNIVVLVIGDQSTSVAEQISQLNGVSEVWLAEKDYFKDGLAENLAPFIAKISSTPEKHFTHILAPATTFGKNLLPRVAALLNVAQLSEVIKITSTDTFVRPMYAGNVLATVKTSDPIIVMTIRTTAFEGVTIHDKKTTVPINTFSNPQFASTMNVNSNQSYDLKISTVVKRETSKTVRPELTAARVVISGGRGMQSAENFKLLENVADLLNGAIGASRAAVDAGFVPNDYQIGQTGKVVAPELYIAVGISGAIQHLAGMKDSKIIVAINKDPEAPIFQIANYGIVGDLFEIVPQFIEALKKLS